MKRFIPIPLLLVSGVAYAQTDMTKTSIIVPVIAIVLIFLIFRYLKSRQENPKNRTNVADTAMINDEMSWAKRTTEAIESLDENDPNYEDKKWFFEQVFLFYSDRTGHHPNPGIPLGKVYDWKLPEQVDRSMFIYEHAVQEENPYMSGVLLNYGTMKEAGWAEELQIELYDKMNNAVEEYKRGEISFLDFHLVRDTVYRQIPEFSDKYENAKAGVLIKEYAKYGLSVFVGKKSEGS